MAESFEFTDEMVRAFSAAYYRVECTAEVFHRADAYRAGLAAAAPLIAAQDLRRAAEEIRAELVCCDVYERDHDTPRAGTDHDHAICFWGEAAARINDGRADELERGTDRG